MKKIVLPPTEGGYYRFGELPQIIAEALHPDELYPDDYILSVVIWRDDGTELGQYIECTPPAGSRERDTSRHAEWTQRPIELTDEEKTHPDRCKWVNWRWHEQRRPEGERAYWPESGELIVWGDDTQNELDQIVSIASERDWYQKRMSEAARRGQDDPRRLCVVDGNLNSLTYTHGAALDRGWVHIDKLNQWGATLDTVNVFSIGEGLTQESGQPTATETAKQRRHRWLAEFEEVGQVQRVYEAEKQRNPSADRSYIGKQIKKAAQERDEARRGQATPTRPTATKKANPFSGLGVTDEDA